MTINRLAESKKTKPNKANLFRIEYCVMRIAKRNLKKQSQFHAFESPKGAGKREKSFGVPNTNLS